MNRRLTWKVIGDAGRATANICGLVMMMLLASNFFAFVFDALGGQDLVTRWLTDLPGGKWGFIIIANIAVFLLGVNLEFLEISFIVMPIFTPIAAELGIDLVWFLVMMAVEPEHRLHRRSGSRCSISRAFKPPEVERIRHPHRRAAVLRFAARRPRARDADPGHGDLARLVSSSDGFAVLLELR